MSRDQFDELRRNALLAGFDEIMWPLQEFIDGRRGRRPIVNNNRRFLTALSLT